MIVGRLSGGDAERTSYLPACRARPFTSTADSSGRSRTVFPSQKSRSAASRRSSRWSRWSKKSRRPEPRAEPRAVSYAELASTSLHYDLRDLPPPPGRVLSGMNLNSRLMAVAGQTFSRSQRRSHSPASLRKHSTSSPRN